MTAIKIDTRTPAERLRLIPFDEMSPSVIALIS